jgi:hypothetical protein
LLSKGQPQLTTLQNFAESFRNFVKEVWEELLNATQENLNTPALQITIPAELFNTFLKSVAFS